MQRFPSFPGLSILSTVVVGFALLSPLPCCAQLPIDTGQTGSAALMSQQIADIQSVVDRWDEAVTQHDQYGLELVLAPQYIDISDTGQVTNRDQQISEMMMKDAPRLTFTQKVVSVRIVGDVAVANGTYDRAYQGSRLSRTKPLEQKGVFSQVYVRARNTWECINSQRTIIQEPILKGKKKSKEDSNEKPLNHDLGFHLPGLHHSSSSDSQPQ
ncbi:MAG TPA: nuclear transport factor 2 family protein [Acidobacteriaceae bacterium]|nr:nuclear transport factor 2 family protein [Acidobacteriaceae bacterium]